MTLNHLHGFLHRSQSALGGHAENILPTIHRTWTHPPCQIHELPELLCMPLFLTRRWRPVVYLDRCLRLQMSLSALRVIWRSCPPDWTSRWKGHSWNMVCDHSWCLQTVMFQNIKLILGKHTLQDGHSFSTITSGCAACINLVSV